MDIFYTIYRQVVRTTKTNMSFCILMAVMTIGITSTSLSTQSFAQQADNITGTFNHTQTDTSGNIDWLNTGNWSMTGMTSDSPSFEAVINMAKPDDSAAHDHQVNEFSLVGSSVSQGNITILNGTTTITMREGPVTEEPTVITLSDENVSVYFEPTKIDDHFGNQSVTGTVSS